MLLILDDISLGLMTHFYDETFCEKNLTVFTSLLTKVINESVNLHPLQTILFTGHRFDSCWEHSDFPFNPSMPVSLIENIISSFTIFSFKKLI